MNASLPHRFDPDVFGDCQDCPLPASNRIHMRPLEDALAGVIQAGITTATAVLEPGTHARTTDSGTSHAAAHELTDKAVMLRRLLTAYVDVIDFADLQPTGLTAEQAASVAGYSPADGAWKRVSDLKRLGWIEPTGATRRGSSGRQLTVCAITDAGRQALR